VNTTIPEILAQINDEAQLQNAANDAADLRDGTSRDLQRAADAAELALVLSVAATGTATWVHALSLPFFRVASTVDDDEALRFELVKLAASAVGWIEQIDKRNGK
jgi:hypothetical protein